MFIQQYLWLPYVDPRVFYTVDSFNNGSCISTPIAAVISFISQFALLGGELWFFVISYDLRMAYTNPFSSFKENKKFYDRTVVFFSLLCSGILMIIGPKEYGLAAEGVLWIQNARNGQSNIAKIFLFYLWIGLIYTYCVHASFQLNIKMKKGFTDTLSIKLSIIKRASKYVLAYSLYWAIFLLLEIFSFGLGHGYNSRLLVSIVAYGFSIRGIWALGVICYTNWAELSLEIMLPFLYQTQQQKQQNLVNEVVEEHLLMKPHLNIALRSEILYFTTQGIMFAARECEKHGLNSLENNSINNPTDIETASNEQMNSNNEEDKLYSFQDVRQSQRLDMETLAKLHKNLTSAPSNGSRMSNTTINTNNTNGNKSVLSEEQSIREVVSEIARIQEKQVSYNIDFNYFNFNLIFHLAT